MVIAVGCSGNSPILPDTANGANPEITPAHNSQSDFQTSKNIWGYWEIAIDTETHEVEIVPLRGAQYTVDVVTFLQPPAGKLSNLQIAVNDVTEWFTQGLIGVDVGLEHPFKGFDKYGGFDVMGLFITPGSRSSNYDPDVVWTNGDDEPVLINSDGYCRWMNPTEFPDMGTILDFTPGALGDKDISKFTSTINGYKLFADGLDLDEDVVEYYSDPAEVDGRGMFSSTAFNHRQYNIKFPLVDQLPSIVFQYAVVASWVEPDPALSGNPDILEVPGDFPFSANADEAIYVGITDNSTVWHDGNSGGGSINLDLEILDWGSLQNSMGVTGELHQVIIEGPSGVIPGDYVIFDSTYLAIAGQDGNTGISSIYNFDIGGVSPQNTGVLPILIIVESEEPADFDPGTGLIANDDRLAAYFRYNIPLGTDPGSSIQVTAPNGGETLYQAMSYDITWDPGSAGDTDVMIEWSTDNFVSDVNEIIDSTANDGSYEWKPIPVVDTTTARVRITGLTSAESDTSDGDFSIVIPLWFTFENPWVVDTDTVSPLGNYDHSRDEISPALVQDKDGTIHILFYGINVGSVSADAQVRSENGNTWMGYGSFWSTGGVNYARGDYAKAAPDHVNSSWAVTGLSFPGSYGYGWYSNIDRFLGGTGFYCFDGVNFSYQVNKYAEIATDTSGYIYMFGDSQTVTSLYWRKTNQPGFISGGSPGQTGPVQLLDSTGTVSKTRSWARQGDDVALVYFNPAGEIRLAETTDGPDASTWDTSEVIWDKGTDYSQVHTPSLAEGTYGASQTMGSLYAAWVAKTNGGQWQVLASVRPTSSDPWSTPAIAATSATEFHDVAISIGNVNITNWGDQDVAVVSWENGMTISTAISPLDCAAFLPAADVTSGLTAQQSDHFCPNQGFGYLYDAIFTYSFDDVNWDIGVRHANFTVQ